MKNKKIIFIVLFAILFILFGCSKSFASVEYELNGNKVQLPDLLPEMKDKHYILVYTDYYPGYQFIIAKDWTTDSIFYTDGGKYIYYDNNASFDYYLCRSNNDELKWEYFGTYNYINYDGRPDLMMFSTENIYNSDKSTIFFQGLLQGHLAPILWEVTSQEELVLQETIALLPLILVVVVSLVGLRKGLKMLETFLHQS